jgi:hypothetical protein
MSLALPLPGVVFSGSGDRSWVQYRHKLVGIYSNQRSAISSQLSGEETAPAGAASSKFKP